MIIDLELKQFKEKLMLVKGKAEIKTKLLEVSNTIHLVELKKNMQYLLEAQIKQQKISNKKESERSSFVK